MGFGQLTIYSDYLDGKKLMADTECMGEEFAQQVFDALLKTIEITG